ncbi:MAG TPA: M15 family metallopeptidase [Kofleriaceae bacterium]
MTAAIRPKRLGKLARLTVATAVLGGLVAVLATARAARMEPSASGPALLTAAESDDAQAEVVDPVWNLEVEPIERTGYRYGRRQVFEVVPLGPYGVEVELRTARAFLAMRGAAAAAGIELGLESGFRTIEQQRALFRAWRKGRGNKAARPGQSNHQSGRALDIAGVTAPGALPWLEANAPLFGFQRTVKNEPWHWEYVEVPVARGATKRVKRKPAKVVRAVGHARRPTGRSVAMAPHASKR